MVSHHHINEVFLELVLRRRHPTGMLDKYGCWRTANPALLQSDPSGSWHYWSELAECRSRAYVTRVAYAFCCGNINELRNRV